MHLLRTMAGVCAVGALMLVANGTANAQAAKSGSYMVRLGGYLPSGGDAKEALGTNFLSFGIGKNIRRFESFLPGTIEVYADYFDRIKHNDVSGLGRVQATVAGVGLQAKYNLDPTNALSFKPYAGVGFGLYWARLKQTTPDKFSQEAKRTTFGGKFLVGAEVRGGAFGEAEYTFAPNPSIFGNKVNLSGGQLRVGYRF